MKSSQLNSSEQPPAMSASSSRDNPCLGHDSNAAAAAYLTDDGISYLLPYAQFLYAERMANPALEKGPEASPEKMSIHGSTRYPTFRVDESRCVPQFLLNYFKTDEGLQQLVKICPGSAGRNRVLSIRRIPEVLVPLPPLAEQRRVVAQIEKLSTQISEAQKLRRDAAEEAEALIPRVTATLLDKAGWSLSPLGEILAEKPRNGLGPQQEVESGGRAMLCEE